MSAFATVSKLSGPERFLSGAKQFLRSEIMTLKEFA